MRAKPVRHATAKRDIPISPKHEMRRIMKSAVDHVYTFLLLKEQNREAYESLLSFGELYTANWDEPVLTRAFNAEKAEPNRIRELPKEL